MRYYGVRPISLPFLRLSPLPASPLRPLLADGPCVLNSLSPPWRFWAWVWVWRPDFELEREDYFCAPIASRILEIAESRVQNNVFVGERMYARRSRVAQMNVDGGEYGANVCAV